MDDSKEIVCIHVKTRADGSKYCNIPDSKTCPLSYKTVKETMYRLEKEEIEALRRAADILDDIKCDEYADNIREIIKEEEE